jgi:hypothetical protein
LPKNLLGPILARHQKLRTTFASYSYTGLHGPERPPEMKPEQKQAVTPQREIGPLQEQSLDLDSRFARLLPSATSAGQGAPFILSVFRLAVKLVVCVSLSSETWRKTWKIIVRVVVLFAPFVLPFYLRWLRSPVFSPTLKPVNESQFSPLMTEAFKHSLWESGSGSPMS